MPFKRKKVVNCNFSVILFVDQLLEILFSLQFHFSSSKKIRRSRYGSAVNAADTLYIQQADKTTRIQYIRCASAILNTLLFLLMVNLIISQRNSDVKRGFAIFRFPVILCLSCAAAAKPCSFTDPAARRRAALSRRIQA